MFARRRSPRKPALLLPLLVAAALGLAACGSGDDAELLPGGTAREIRANLAEVRRLADEGECVGARDAALQVSEQVEALGGVDARLKAALQEGTDRLNEVLLDCDEAEEEELESEPSISEEPLEVEEEEEPERGDERGEGNRGKGIGREKQQEPEPQPEEEETEPTQPEGGEEVPPAEAPPSTPGGGTPSGGVSPSAPAGGE